MSKRRIKQIKAVHIVGGISRICVRDESVTCSGYVGKYSAKVTKLGRTERNQFST